VRLRLVEDITVSPEPEHRNAPVPVARELRVDGDIERRREPEVLEPTGAGAAPDRHNGCGGSRKHHVSF
jgi:hypothetical protein